LEVVVSFQLPLLLGMELASTQLAELVLEVQSLVGAVVVVRA
jgi:hypothetical protein